MSKVLTIYQALKVDWIIKKQEIRDMGINPDKEWNRIMLFELEAIADHLDVLISDITES